MTSTNPVAKITYVIDPAEVVDLEESEIFEGIYIRTAGNDNVYVSKGAERSESDYWVAPLSETEYNAFKQHFSMSWCLDLYILSSEWVQLL